ncbi:VOC family protein [Massilia yuzhufengensis]|uniref:Catechol 2,3-dioxygenase n=1 Tax=Massilia yuzhufengensis TaxID=1164594 RepID=A0A1I1UJ44_9BURK|nr:VOC family protein [Massilia yuzhufengensis]SFD68773.1 Catechol 2,3-dioxygenase [Massilia yuzhufengensis]
MPHIAGIDHVQVAIPPGADEAARAFYGGVLGMAEIPKPAPLIASGGMWFQVGATQLHIGSQLDFKAAKKAHPAFLVDGYAGFCAQLSAGGVTVREEEPVAGRRRAGIEDPFGNRIELIEAARE